MVAPSCSTYGPPPMLCCSKAVTFKSLKRPQLGDDQLLRFSLPIPLLYGVARGERRKGWKLALMEGPQMEKPTAHKTACFCVQLENHRALMGYKCQCFTRHYRHVTGLKVKNLERNVR